MPGSSDHQRLALRDADFDNLGGGRVRTEVHHHIRIRQCRGEIVTCVESRRHRQRELGRGGNQRLSHPSLGAVDDESGGAHETVHVSSMAKSVRRFASCRELSGNRTSSDRMMPLRAIAAFTGTGLDSMKMPLKTGYSLR